jgi:energy-coupling factor transporter ATP-binding protein EcfA2
MNHEEQITYFASTDSRNKKIKFGIKAKDRTRHMYVIGKTGMGKSTLLENMAVQDIQNGEGFAFIDPHGATAEKLLEYIPEERIQDVLYFAPFDLENPISFNVMEDVGADKRHLVAAGLMSTFEKIWVDAWSARMAYILNNTLLALLEYPSSTLLGINRMLSDKGYRKKVVDNVMDPSVKSFWTDEFAKYNDRFAVEATAAIQNKVGQFTSNPLIRNIIGQPKSAFDMREILDTRKIFIVNLAKGKVGEGNANLLGSMLITKIYLAAMSRADASEAAMRNLPNFYLYVDEFQSFANKSFADILSEARKYKLNLTMAHQYIEQMSEEVRAAVFGNVGTMVSFRVGAFDAEMLEKEFAPVFTAEDMVNLGFAQIYLKLMIDGVSSQPFSAMTLPPITPTHASFKERVITWSREHFGKPRALVEENIKKWHEPIAPIAPLKPQAQSAPPAQSPKAPRPQSTQRASPAESYGQRRAQPLRHTQQRFERRRTQYASADRQERRPPPAPAKHAPQSGTRGEKSFGEEREKEISLSELKHPAKTMPQKAGPKFTKTKKEPSEANKADLRSALASVMEKKNKEKEPAGVQGPAVSGKTESVNEHGQSGHIPKEIPEDTLKKLLDIDEERK